MSYFHDIISRRRSTRKFTEEQLTPEQVELILKAGLKSPSSKSSTPWQFIVIEDKEQLEKLSLCKKTGSKLISNCTLAVIIVADPSVSDVWIEDASIATIMMQLQAEDLGLGSCWIQIRERHAADDISSEEYIRELFNIPSQLRVLSVVAMGNKEKERPPFDDEKLQWEKVHIGNYKQ